MILEPPISKQPGETFLISVEFQRRFKGGESIASQSITSKKVSDGSDSTSSIISGPTFAGSISQCRLAAAGTPGDDHIVQFRVTTTSANVFEAEVRLSVREE